MARRTTAATLSALIVIALLVLSGAPWIMGGDQPADAGTPARTLQGEGVGNVTVTATDDAGRPLHNVKLTIIEITLTNYTDNGTANFTEVPANITGVEYNLRANLTKYQDGYTTFVVFENQTSEVSVILRGCTLWGTVTDSAERIIDATVSVADVAPDAEPFISTAVSKTDGEFLLVGLPGGTYVVNASAPGFSSQALNMYLPVGGITPRMDFNLDPLGGSISGRVYDARSGVPLNNASVSVVVGSVTTTVTSDIEGDYIIPNVPQGVYSVKAEKTGYNSGTLTGVEVVGANESTGNDFYLTEKQTRVYGIVRSGTLLLVGVNISVVGTSVYNISGPDGSYEIRNLTVGIYTLTASAVGYKTLTARNLTVPMGGEVQQNFNMEGLPGGILRGKVYVANTGEPLSNVQITIVNLRPQPISRASNINGEFEFAGLAAGEYTIHLEKAGYRPIEVGNILVTNGTPVNLTLEMTVLREGFGGFIFGFDMAHSMMILALFLTILILAVAIYLRVRSFQTPENAPAVYDEPEEAEEGAGMPSEGEGEERGPEDVTDQLER